MDNFCEYTKEFDGVVYLVSPAFRDVPVEEQIGPVETSHIQFLGYNIITHFSNSNVVNYSWININDHICDIMDDNTEKVILNSVNLNDTVLVGKKKINLEVNVTCGLLELVRELLGFLKNNSHIVNKIVFKGSLEYGCSEVIHLCKTYGVDVEVVESKVERDSYIKKLKNCK